MQPKAKAAHGYLNIFLVRLLLIGLLLIGIRFAYQVTIAGEACNLGNFCFSSLGDAFISSSPDSSKGSSIIIPSRDGIDAVQFYSSIFRDLVMEGYLVPSSKAVCVESFDHEVLAMREIGISDSVGVSVKSVVPLIIKYQKPFLSRFSNNTVDFIFSAWLSSAPSPWELALEITRVLKPNSHLVLHVTPSDEYSFNSLLELFPSFQFVRSREFPGYNSSSIVKEIVLKDNNNKIKKSKSDYFTCFTPRHKTHLVEQSEPLILEEPLKPWLTLKRNIKNIKYLPSMADISYKNRYIYIDVGSRSYVSSIGSWFKKQYPKQNKTFSIYAIEADKAFHSDYASRKGVTLIPQAAWVRNETLEFEGSEKGKGMGRIQKGGGTGGKSEEILGFDFAEWVKKSARENDLVVMKMDVEGAEFELIPKMIKTGAICLIDEMFLECHYNRWQRCCPGERSPKYNRTYADCITLFTSLRNSGVLVHQWW